MITVISPISQSLNPDPEYIIYFYRYQNSLIFLVNKYIICQLAIVYSNKSCIDFGVHLV